MMDNGSVVTVSVRRGVLGRWRWKVTGDSSGHLTADDAIQAAKDAMERRHDLSRMKTGPFGDMVKLTENRGASEAAGEHQPS